MKATKYFLILLALVALFMFACKAKVETDEVVETEEVALSPLDQWIADVKVVVETWEAKAEAGNLTQADMDAFVAAQVPLEEAAKDLDLNNPTDEQRPILNDLMARMSKLNTETIPAAMAK